MGIENYATSIVEFAQRTQQSFERSEIIDNAQAILDALKWVPANQPPENNRRVLIILPDDIQHISNFHKGRCVQFPHAVAWRELYVD